MANVIKIANFLRGPIYWGAKTFEFTTSLFTLSTNSTFGKVMDSLNYMFKANGLGFDIFTEAVIKSSDQDTKNLPFSEVFMGIYDYLTGISPEQLYANALNGDIDSLQLLLSKGITKNHILLEDILRTEYAGTAKYILSHGFVDSKNVNFTTVLCYSSSDRTANMTEIAVEYGADVNFKCWGLITPLETAVQQNSLANVITLVKNHAIIAPNILISFASENKYLESGIIPFLTSQGVDPNYRNGNSTLFYNAVTWGQYKLANYLLQQYNVEVNTEHFGWTPLKRAISACSIHSHYCSTDFIRKMINYGADIKYKSSEFGVFEDILQMSAKIDENVSDIIVEILCRSNFTNEEVNEALNIKMSHENNLLLIEYKDNSTDYCNKFYEDNFHGSVANFCEA